MLSRLMQNGLGEVTFSVDTVNSALFSKIRGGAQLETVLANLKKVPEGLKRSIFVTLSQENIQFFFSLKCHLKIFKKKKKKKK